MVNYSILDLSPIVEGGTAQEALQNTIQLAQHVEPLGYKRFWVAEHHAMPGVASAATAVLVGQIAANTKSMRVGAGGIMLPNHAPLMVAEQFGTLAEFYPGRIDLGLGRAPGTDGATARALRRYFDGADRFPQDVLELMAYLGDPNPQAAIQAVPGQGSHVPIYMLGSSLNGAELAAQFGLPYAFASHFAPDMLEEALFVYRKQFRPSAALDKPYAMVAVNVFGAESAEEAEYMKSSQILAFLNLRMGQPSPLPAPVEKVKDIVPERMLAGIEQALRVSASGPPTVLRQDLKSIIDRYQPDELILTGMMHDPQATRRSFSMAAEALQSLAVKEAV